MDGRPECQKPLNKNVVLHTFTLYILSHVPGSSELSKHYSQKVALEQELPNITQKLRTTNECLLSSLASLTNNTHKVSQQGAPAPNTSRKEPLSALLLLSRRPIIGTGLVTPVTKEMEVSAASVCLS